MTIVAAVVGIAGASAAGMSGAAIPSEALQTAEWRVMDVLAQLYGKTDSSPVAAYMVEDPGEAGNPNTVSIPLSLGNMSLNRFEARNHISRRCLSASVASSLGLSVQRLEARQGLAPDRKLSSSSKWGRYLRHFPPEATPAATDRADD